MCPLTKVTVLLEVLGPWAPRSLQTAGVRGGGVCDGSRKEERWPEGSGNLGLPPLDLFLRGHQHSLILGLSQPPETHMNPQTQCLKWFLQVELFTPYEFSQLQIFCHLWPCSVDFFLPSLGPPPTFLPPAPSLPPACREKTGLHSRPTCPQRKRNQRERWHEN